MKLETLIISLELDTSLVPYGIFVMVGKYLANIYSFKIGWIDSTHFRAYRGLMKALSNVCVSKQVSLTGINGGENP